MSYPQNTKPAVRAAGIEPERKTVSKKSTTSGGDVKGLRIFDFDGARVRIVIRNGAPLFHGQDVCGVLGIRKYRDAVATLEPEERVSVAVDTPGGKQNSIFVTESGLYSLVFLSRDPKAKKFRKWVTSVVLPTIRRTGRYEFRREDLVEIPEAALLNHNVMRDCSKVMASSVSDKRKIIDLRTGTCQAVTGKHPKEIRQQGEVLGLKYRERESALQVLRSIGDINASVVASINLMLADGASLPKALEQKDKLASVFGELRTALLAGGLDEKRFSSLSREEISRLMAEYQERKRALDLQLAFDFSETVSEEN